MSKMLSNPKVKVIFSLGFTFFFINPTNLGKDNLGRLSLNLEFNLRSISKSDSLTIPVILNPMLLVWVMMHGYVLLHLHVLMPDLIFGRE